MDTNVDTNMDTNVDTNADTNVDINRVRAYVIIVLLFRGFSLFSPDRIGTLNALELETKPFKRA